MHDPVEIRRRIQRLVSRGARRDDYGQVLARGDVVRKIGDVDDPHAWREKIRRQARADGIKVRTGSNERAVYAGAQDVGIGLEPNRLGDSSRQGGSNGGRPAPGGGGRPR